jgi:hypothetical protein
MNCGPRSGAAFCMCCKAFSSQSLQSVEQENTSRVLAAHYDIERFCWSRLLTSSLEINRCDYHNKHMVSMSVVSQRPMVSTVTS